MGTLKEITFQLTQLVRLRLENSDILIPPVSNSGTIYCIPLTVNLFLAVIIPDYSSSRLRGTNFRLQTTITPVYKIQKQSVTKSV